MKTIPGKIDPSWPRGTYRARCDYCGAGFMRHQLRRNESGFLACPDDQQGRDEVMLNRLNVQHSTSNYRTTKVQDGGSDPDANNLPVIHRTLASDITRINS